MQSNLFKWVWVVLLSCCLSSCYSSFCGYIWNRAEVAEATWIPEPDKAELYRVGDDFYAKACRGKVRGCQSGGMPFHSIAFDASLNSWQPLSVENETIYLKVRRLSRCIENNEKPHRYRLYDDRSSLLTTLPAHAVRLNGPGILPRVKTEWQYRELRKPVPCTEPTIDAHALYAWPLGLATAIVVDVPCSIVMSAGAAAGAVLSIPYIIYEQVK